MENKTSPVVLANSCVVDGIGQMIVLAVGQNTFKSRNNVITFEEPLKKSCLQQKIDDFFALIKTLAYILSLGICIIKLLRVFIEL